MERVARAPWPRSGRVARTGPISRRRNGRRCVARRNKDAVHITAVRPCPPRLRARVYNPTVIATLAADKTVRRVAVHVERAPNNSSCAATVRDDDDDVLPPRRRARGQPAVRRMTTTTTTADNRRYPARSTRRITATINSGSALPTPRSQC